MLYYIFLIGECALLLCCVRFSFVSYQAKRLARRNVSEMAYFVSSWSQNHNSVRQWSMCACVHSVLYCSLLAQAQSDVDKQKIEKQMESDVELAKILHQLQEADKEDIVHEERERRQAARKSRVEMDLDAMDTDDAGVSHHHHHHTHTHTRLTALCPGQPG